MSTTGKNFVALSASTLTGSGYATNGVALALTSRVAAEQAALGLATILDKFTSDASTSGYAKNGCVILNLTASTPVTVDFTSLSSMTVVAGDPTFATWNEIIFNNTGVQDVIVSPGASNPLTTPLAGTTPTFTIYAGEVTRWRCPAGKTVDATHKNLKFDPGAANANISIVVSGA